MAQSAQTAKQNAHRSFWNLQKSAGAALDYEQPIGFSEQELQELTPLAPNPERPQ